MESVLCRWPMKVPISSWQCDEYSTSSVLMHVKSLNRASEASLMGSHSCSLASLVGSTSKLPKINETEACLYSV
ncbi:hypothetical protein L484_027513 [Morus notabilis]|uniref:Uncharacterized protein n=1 Tax=Morus notabilis TaxID=981085 RepID=W9SMJ0_9ROSA|nr:hypothetical protein L484_027513 [Morus notabilis]